MSVHSLSIYERSDLTTIQKPKEITRYSKSKDGTISVNDTRYLRYYYFPDEELDKRGLYNLAIGRKDFQNSRSKLDDPCSLRGLLESIQSLESRNNAVLRANLITFRGIIRKSIMCAYEKPVGDKSVKLDLRVAVFDGQIFIKEVNSKEKEIIDLNSYTGYKFETLTTLDKPVQLVSRDELTERPRKTVENGDEFVTVVRTGIGSCKMILGGEVDCVSDFLDEDDDPLSHYMELKCTQAIYNFRDTKIFQRKLFKTWLQCFLIGIPKIAYGFRDGNYDLVCIEEFLTTEVPNLLGHNDPRMKWQCTDAMRWFGKFVEWLMGILLGDCDIHQIKPYRLTFKGTHLQLTELSPSDPEFEAIANGEAVLTRQFVEWRRSLKQRRG